MFTVLGLSDILLPHAELSRRLRVNWIKPRLSEITYFKSSTEDFAVVNHEFIKSNPVGHLYLLKLCRLLKIKPPTVLNFWKRPISPYSICSIIMIEVNTKCVAQRKTSWIFYIYYGETERHNIITGALRWLHKVIIYGVARASVMFWMLCFAIISVKILGLSLQL